MAVSLLSIISIQIRCPNVCPLLTMSHSSQGVAESPAVNQQSSETAHGQQQGTPPERGDSRKSATQTVGEDQQRAQGHDEQPAPERQR